MTSFTKALYRRDPAAALAFYEQQKFEAKSAPRQPGMPTLTFASNATSHVVFGKRQAVLGRGTACAASCGHPACANGCTRWGKHSG